MLGEVVLYVYPISGLAKSVRLSYPINQDIFIVFH